MKGKPKKKPLNQRVELKCTQMQKDRIQERIKQLNIKQSDYIRMLIEQDLKEMEGK